MIIISQDKTDIINFENISWLYVESNDFTINVALKYGGSISIAKYKTEEKAKEVLQKLIQAYREYRTAEVDGYTNVLEETTVFEMPEK